jgi:hypothetical protein
VNTPGLRRFADRGQPGRGEQSGEPGPEAVTNLGVR